MKTVRRRARSDGERTRSAILETAARLATIEGLDGLSIGGLANAIGMSKSGLYAHFGSKQELQLATIDAARAIFVDVVVGPALSTEGVQRLRALCETFLSYVEQRVFPGGCFFAGAAVEVGSRKGPVRNRLARYQRQWMALLEQTAAEARDRGELNRRVDLTQLAFELNALLVAANTAYVLHDDPAVLGRARVAIEHRLSELTPSAQRAGPRRR